MLVGQRNGCLSSKRIEQPILGDDAWPLLTENDKRELQHKSSGTESKMKNKNMFCKTSCDFIWLKLASDFAKSVWQPSERDTA
jgi:hypothetical protein